MKFAFLAALTASVLIFTFDALAFDGDSFSQKFDSLPKAVKATATANMQNAFPVSVTTAKSEDGWNYQINTRVDGKFHDIVIDSGGKLIAIKDETELAALPAAAKAVIEKQAASATLMTLEKVTEGSQVSYGAVIKDTTQGAFVQLRVAADGTVKSKN